jgi:hypothetical protein
MVAPNPAALREQLEAVIATPEAYASDAAELIQLSRKAAVSLEGPFEAFQRLVYSVRHPSSPLPLRYADSLAISRCL